MKKSTFLKIFLPIVVLAAALGSYLFIIKPAFRPEELVSVKSDEELFSFYNRSSSGRSSAEELFWRYLTLPFSLLTYDIYDYAYNGPIYMIDSIQNGLDVATESLGPSKESSSSKDFSTTNIQVENVDEADIIKTDGDYLYSISETDVLITDVRDSAAPKVVARIAASDDSVPEDLILAGDVLTVISTEAKSSGLSVFSRHWYSNMNNTSVRIFDVSDRSNPLPKKSFKLYEPYYTSRRIEDKLYVISSGHLRSEDEKSVLRAYEEDFETKEFASTDVRYLRDVKSDVLTLVSVVDLSDFSKEISVSPLLLDISNAYVSENAFYLLDETYDSDLDGINWKSLFGLKGIIGYLLEAYRADYSYDYRTNIFKFSIEDSGEISYAAKTKLSGETINQYSLDEYEENLRVALEDSEGTYVAVLDKSLNLLGTSERLAKDERMYASRFLGDKAYLVTYRNTDPLFVVDLANPKNPKVLGELKIPGYSVYLHPFDESTLLGIGFDSEETVEKDENGRILWTSATITGMKMALFDVSDFSNPKEIAKTSIGDRRTTSAILTNPKALLFSKEKELLAIPVNNYAEDFSIETNESDELDDFSRYFSNYSKSYISEGYLVYSVNLENGFVEKGLIVHENSNLIRGAYIDNDLLTISEKKLMINSLENLELKSELNLAEEGK